MRLQHYGKIKSAQYLPKSHTRTLVGRLTFSCFWFLFSRPWRKSVREFTPGGVQVIFCAVHGGVVLRSRTKSDDVVKFDLSEFMVVLYCSSEQNVGQRYEYTSPYVEHRKPTVGYSSRANGTPAKSRRLLVRAGLQSCALRGKPKHLFIPGTWYVFLDIHHKGMFGRVRHQSIQGVFAR